MVVVTLDTAVTELACIMAEQRISAVPVMDNETMIGIVTEGDLLRRAEIGSEHRRSRWAELVFANWNLAAEYTKEHGRRARDVMTQPVVTIAANATIGEIAVLLKSRHIKRAPVVENGKLVGMVSRANLVQALASSAATLQPSTTVRTGTFEQNSAANSASNRGHFRRPRQTLLWTMAKSTSGALSRRNPPRRAIVVTAENIPGVRRVHDHMDYPPIRPPFLP